MAGRPRVWPVPAAELTCSSLQSTNSFPFSSRKTRHHPILASLLPIETTKQETLSALVPGSPFLGEASKLFYLIFPTLSDTYLPGLVLVSSRSSSIRGIRFCASGLGSSLLILSDQSNLLPTEPTIRVLSLSLDAFPVKICNENMSVTSRSTTPASFA